MRVSPSARSRFIWYSGDVLNQRGRPRSPPATSKASRWTSSPGDGTRTGVCTSRKPRASKKARTWAQTRARSRSRFMATMGASRQGPRREPPKKQLDELTRSAQQAPVLGLAERPGHGDRVERPEDGARGHLGRHVVAELPALLPLGDDPRDRVQVRVELRSAVFPHQPGGLAKCDGHDLGEVALAFEEPQLQLDDPLEPLRRARRCGELSLEVLEEALDAVLEEGHEELLLRLEVQVDGAVGDARRLGHLAHPGRVEPLPGEDPNGGVENALPLVARARRLPTALWRPPHFRRHPARAGGLAHGLPWAAVSVNMCAANAATSWPIQGPRTASAAATAS